MDKEELLLKMERIAKHVNFDTATGHMEFDDLLLEYINDKEITEMYNSIPMWYS